jgi:hypothetical protein
MDSRLPALSSIGGSKAAFHTRPGVVELARLLTTCGAAKRRDWDPGGRGPAALVDRSARRHIQHANRGVSNRLTLHAFVRSWHDYKDDVFAAADDDDPRWVLGIEAHDTFRLRVAPLIEALGETQAGAVLAGLSNYAPFLIEGPEDLEWITDGWYDRATEDKSPESRKIGRMAKKATALTKRITHLLGRARPWSPENQVEDRRLRRLIGLLTALGRHASSPPPNNDPWDETAEVDWCSQRPVIHLIWDEGCPLDHAVSEAEYVTMQDGSHPTPQWLWLLDPADPSQAAQTWQRWIHTLRRIRISALIVDVLEEYIACLRP